MTKSVKFAGENSVFAQRLKAIMKEKGVTQQHLAEQLHMTRQAVSMYLKGQTLPAIDKLLTITDYFDVSADYLIGKTDIRTQDTDVKMNGISVRSQKRKAAPERQFRKRQHRKMICIISISQKG